MHGTRRKGMSLAEICVVLAVISIVALMVTSFTLMVGTRSTVGATRLKVMEDLELTESVLEGWVSRMVSDGAVVTAADGVLSAQKDADTYTVTLEEQSLTAPVPGGQALTVSLSTVTALSVESKHNGSDSIYFCTLTYPDPRGGDGELTYIFCINPRIGEELTVDS